MGLEESSQKVSSYLPDDTIGAFADNILDLVLIGYIEGDLPGSSRGRALMTHFENGFFGSLSLWVIVSFKNPWDPVEKRPNTVHGESNGNRELKTVEGGSRTICRFRVQGKQLNST